MTPWGSGFFSGRWWPWLMPLLALFVLGLTVWLPSWLLSTGAVGGLLQGAEAESAHQRRAERISARLMCVTCDGQTIADSDSRIAKAMRSVVRQKVVQGESSESIMAFFVERYGDQVSVLPPWHWSTALLWLFAPLAAFITMGWRWLGHRWYRRSGSGRGRL